MRVYLFFKISLIFNFVHVCGYKYLSAENVLGDQRCWIPLELELQVVVSCLM